MSVYWNIEVLSYLSVDKILLRYTQEQFDKTSNVKFFSGFLLFMVYVFVFYNSHHFLDVKI